MAYQFADRLKEWTSYAGAAAAGLATVIPQIVPADNKWVLLWQGVQMLVGAAMIFIPQTAGTTAIENDSWTLLRAFANAAPKQYAEPMQPLLAELASHLAKAETTPAVSLFPSQVPAPVVVQPVAVVAPPPNANVFTTPIPAPVPLSEAQIVKPEPKPETTPLVADPAATLRPIR